ncbi:DUF3488 and transglutaminase-like domain-containing protein [Georgenia sp. M64]|uniref:transglutaminase family protein n=1 Tax=Georgenia sp. M64 TaxID=3120520 RepID=UPI0030E57AFE
MNERSRWPDALLAALATAVASWSVTPLLREQPWVGPLLVVLATVAVTGSAARALRLPAPAVLAVQGTLATLVLSWLLVPGDHLYGLPTSRTLAAAAALWTEGLTTVRDEQVPAPATAGLVLLVVAALAAVGLAVDAIGVTGRSPALAGVPLLVVGTVTASNTGDALHPWYFASTAVVWLLLVAREGLGTVRGWSTARTDELTTSVWLGPAVERSRRRYSQRGRVLVAATVALAAVLPAVVPHLPPTTVVEGLARAAGGARGPVTFTETLDLAQDLTSRSEAPVLRFRTDSSRPSPLRVTVSSRYEDGRWLPSARRMGDPPPPEPLLPVGVETEPWSMTVLLNRLSAPQVAMPHPLVAADVGEIAWGLDAATGTALVTDQPASYEATSYRTVGSLPPGTGAWTVPELGDPDLLGVDDASRETVTALAREITAGSTNQVDAATAIQAFLSSEAFVYSLTLADPVVGPDGAELDPVSHFLATRRGYCTQFATAMVMMARASGIPARLAVGFLPGEQDEDGAWTVVAADAHAWPELYVTGLGWTRFEPTPAERAGNRPLYFVQDAPETAEVPGSTAAPVVPDRTAPGLDAGDVTTVGTTSSWTDRVRGLLLPALAVVVALAALLLLVPLAGRRARTAPLRRAEDDADRVEGRWHLLVASLRDLGVDVPVGASPRRSRELLVGAAALHGAGAEALARITDRVERVRYAPGPVREGAMTADVETVLAEVRAVASRRARLRAALVPVTGVDRLAALAAGARAATAATARRVGSVGLQPSSSSRSRPALRTALPPPSLLK